MTSRSDDEFVVGYLPTPPQLRRFLRTTVALILTSLVIDAAVIAARQRDPGPGTWDSDSLHVTGALLVKPYPMLQLSDASGTLLLVGEGKVSAELPPTAADRQTYRASGTIIERGDLRLFELDAPLEPVAAITIKPLPPPTDSLQTLAGEIIDPKCFAGAMKPGNGKTHKTCAALCLRGGIPPTFVTADGRVFVLTDPAGAALTGSDLDQIIRRVGEPITLRGVVSLRDGVRFFRVDPTKLSR